MALRVLIVTPAFGTFGGIETFVFDLARALVARDDVDAALCLKRTRGFTMRPEMRRAIDESPARVELVDSGSPALARAIARADLVHSQNFSPDVGALTRLLRTPLVLTVHGHRPPRLPLRARAGHALSGHARARWFNSDFTWHSWEPEGPRPGSEKLPLRSPASLPPRAPADRRGFVFAARWIENKGLETLVEAYANAAIDRAQWPLTLLGDGPLRPRVEALAARHGLELDAPGFVDDAERDERIRSAKWMVTPPNTREDLGLTPIEARGLGVPVIATRDGGVPESAGPFSLICTPGSVLELRAALEHVAGMDEAEYARLSRATKDLLDRTTATLDVYAERYVAISRSARAA